MQSEHKIKTFRLDNGGEFDSKAFDNFLKDHGIKKQTSTLYTKPHKIWQMPYMPWTNQLWHNLELKYGKIGISIESIRKGRLKRRIAWNALLPPMIGWLSLCIVHLSSTLP